MPQHQRLDRRRIDLAAAADDQIFLAAGDAQVAYLIDAAEVAGHKPSRRVECGLGRRLIVEIAEHQAGAAAADLADLARRGFDVGVILTPNTDLVPVAGAPTGLG